MKTQRIHLGLPLLLLLFISQTLPAQFEDRTNLAGIGNTGQNRGVSIIDFDQDGWEDIYFTRLDGPNPLYRNNGDGTFSNVAAKAGVDYPGASGTAVWGDLDNDGRPDLILGNRREPSRIYRNNPDGTFSDITFNTGVAVNAQVMSVSLADVNRDGWLDVYFANLGEQNALYLNNGDGTFADHTYASGALDEGIAMGTVFFDYDRDGDPDLYLTHDADQPNILYENIGGGHFIDVSRASGLDLAAQGMGVDVADVDQDGWLDVYITNLYENVLFRNRGDGTFEEISAAAGVTDRGMGWGIAFLDYDNDTRPDIYVANETRFAVDYQFFDNVLYRNENGLTFEVVSDDVLKSPYGGYGLAVADLDKNGQPDLVIANSGQEGNQLLLNQQENDHHWTRIKLEGTQSNRSAIGARVTLESGDVLLVDEVNAGTGFAGQNSLFLHFGLGSREQIDRLSILWPSGLEEVFENLPVDQTLSFKENSGLTPVKHLEQSLPVDARIIPNPSSGRFKLQLKPGASVERIELSLYNTYGQLIYRSQELPVSERTVTRTLDVKGKCPDGIYYLRINSGRASKTLKIQISGN